MIEKIKIHIDLLSGINENESEDFNKGWNDALYELLEYIEEIEKKELENNAK